MFKLATVKADTIRQAFASAEECDRLVEGARRHTVVENNETVKGALHGHWRAIMWSLLVSSSLIMEGYDTTLIGNLFALPQFTKHYGVPVGNGTYTITADWQTAVSAGVVIGEVIGLVLGGWMGDRFGYKATMLVNHGLLVGFIFIPFFAPNIQTLLAAEILQGIPWGTFQALSVTYAADVMPVVLRQFLTAYANLCWIFGQMIAAGVLRGILSLPGKWAYKLPFALQWIWPVIIVTGLIFVPESPWYLVRQGRYDDARKVLGRLSPMEEDEVDDRLALIRYTDLLEKVTSEKLSYRDCFRGADLRRTEVACGVWMVQVLCGIGLMGFSTYFLIQAGVSTTSSFSLTLGQYAIGAVGTMSSWFLMRYFGRRTLYICGLTLLMSILLVIGGLGWKTAPGSKASYAVGALLLVWTLVYDCTVGPVGYTLVAEAPSTRLRAKTVTLARACFNLCTILLIILLPRMINPLAWNWGAKSGLFWAGTCLLCLVWSVFRCPETKGRTSAQLDVLFESGIPAWRFASAKVDEFSSGEEEQKVVVIEEKAEDDVHQLE